MIYIIKTFFFIGAFLATVGILEIFIAISVFIYRMHLSIFSNAAFGERPTPRYVQVMEKLFFTGAVLVFLGALICAFTTQGINH